MKKIIALTIAAAVFGLAAANAAPDKKEKKAVDGKDRPIPARIMEQYDKDKDGKLNDEEKAAWKKDHEARKAEWLKQYDKNKDGKLDETEKAAAREAEKEKFKEKIKEHGKKDGKGRRK